MLRRDLRSLPFVICALLVSMWLPTSLDAQELPETWQEQQNYRSGPTPFEPLMEFWYELDAMSELVSMQPPWLLIDVHGVGFEVEAPMTTIYALPATGNDVTLFTHYQVREDAHLLYGFATLDERRLFRSLLKVSGVGAKLALTILSGIEANAFAQCVNEGDTAKLVQLPGVGKKTAERLIVEMRDRLDDWSLPDAAAATSEPAAAAGDPVHDAVAVGRVHRGAVEPVQLLRDRPQARLVVEVQLEREQRQPAVEDRIVPQLMEAKQANVEAAKAAGAPIEV